MFEIKLVQIGPETAVTNDNGPLYERQELQIKRGSLFATDNVTYPTRLDNRRSLTNNETVRPVTSLQSFHSVQDNEILCNS